MSGQASHAEGVSRRGLMVGSAAALLAASAAAGFGVAAAAPAAAAELVWVNPMIGKRTSPFGYRVHPITGATKFHYGQDVASSSGRSAIGAVAAGRVVSVGFQSSFGNYVEVSHSNGVTSFYAHLTRATVSNGATVVAGQQIAVEGETGGVTGPHLHLEIRPAGERSQSSTYDPVRYLAARGVDLGRSSTTPPVAPPPPVPERGLEEYGASLIKADNLWYVVDFGQRSFWRVDSSTHLNWLVDVVGMFIAGDDYTADYLNGYRRLANSA